MSIARRRNPGFTLIELMVAVAIVALLVSLAVPAYRQHVIRTHRSAAQSAMMDIAIREQHFLLANRVYADEATLAANGYVLPPEVSANYTWEVDADPAIPPVFTIRFTPRAGTGQAGDVTLTLNQRGDKTPAEKWRR